MKVTTMALRAKWGTGGLDHWEAAEFWGRERHVAEHVSWAVAETVPAGVQFGRWIISNPHLFAHLHSTSRAILSVWEAGGRVFGDEEGVRERWGWWQRQLSQSKCLHCHSSFQTPRACFVQFVSAARKWRSSKKQEAACVMCRLRTHGLQLTQWVVIPGC